MGEPNHIAWLEIIDTLDGTSEPSAADVAHLAACASCRELRDVAQQLLGMLGRARLEPVPSELIERTLARVRGETIASTADSTWQQLIEKLQAGLEELQIRLVADSLVPSMALRGADTAAARTVLYETDAYSIALSLDAPAAGSGGTLRGQVIPRTGDFLPTGSRAILRQPDHLAEAKLDDLGEFDFSGLASDPLRLALILGQSFIQLGPLPGAGSRPEPDLRDA